MKINYSKSRWEYGFVPFEIYLDRVVADGFDGAEVFLLPEKIDTSRIRDSLRTRNLFLIAQVITLGKTPEEHLLSLEEQVPRAKAAGALFANSHAGSDFFSFEENVRIFQRAAELSLAHDLPIYQETHRGRALYNVPDTLRYLEALPDLLITADFSHFMCVHESLLEDQESLLDPIIAKTRHIHARVGFQQGPQVPHPLAPERASLLERYLGLWRKMLAAIENSGAKSAAITPEAGPPGYMPVLPFTNLPVADAWTVNVQMKDWLRTKL